MPGENCVFVGCPVSRTKRYIHLSLFKIPSEKQVEWREEVVKVVSRTRDLKSFNINSAHVCSRHYEETCFEYGKFIIITYYYY